MKWEIWEVTECTTLRVCLEGLKKTGVNGRQSPS